MQFNEKLQILRKNKGMSQEALAETFGISRQAVSRWESGQVYPETEKLVAMSEFFNISLDALIKEGDLLEKTEITDHTTRRWNGFNRDYEYKSTKTLWGMPIVHINTGSGMKKAKGIIAIGLLFALAVISLGTIAFGAITFGLISFGAVAIGMYSQGALAVASRIAIGDHAYGYIAVAQTVASGTNQFLSSSSSLSNILREEVRLAINEAFPNTWNWIVNFMTMFLAN